MSASMRNEINQFKAIVYELNLSPSELQTHIKDEGQFNIVAHVIIKNRTRSARQPHSSCLYRVTF